jgi:hypothetical protein
VIIIFEGDLVCGLWNQSIYSNPSMVLHLQLQQKIQVLYHKGALTTLWLFDCGKFIVFNCKWKYYETAARFPGEKKLSRTQWHKGIVASENLVKFVLCTKFVLVWGLGLSSPYTWYHGKNESWDWYRGLRPVSTLCSNTGNKDLTWLVCLEAIPALYEHQPSRDLNWY